MDSGPARGGEEGEDWRWWRLAAGLARLGQGQARRRTARPRLAFDFTWEAQVDDKAAGSGLDSTLRSIRHSRCRRQRFTFLAQGTLALVFAERRAGRDAWPGVNLPPLSSGKSKKANQHRIGKGEDAWRSAIQLDMFSRGWGDLIRRTG